jgi:hypothetical protein
MPKQTLLTQNVSFPDGCALFVDAGAGYNDMGSVDGTVESVLEWKENRKFSANAGAYLTQIKDMTINGKFNWTNLNPDRLNDLGGGMFKKSTTAGDPVSTIPAQTIAVGWTDSVPVELVMKTSPTVDTLLRMGTTKPTISSVTLNAGAPEALVEDETYVLVIDSQAVSGWAIQFISSEMSTMTPKTYSISIVYGTNTPIARTSVSVGSTSQVLTAYKLKFEHTDDNGLVRGVEIYAANPKTGGFNFSFKGADEDGVETMTVSFTGEIDTSRTNKEQLMTWYIDSGAA